MKIAVLTAWSRRPKRKKRLTRHELQYEVKMLEVERNRAVWERNRLANTVQELMDEMRQTILWSTEALVCAEEIVADQFKRDGGATDAPARSAMGATSSRT